MNNTFINNIVIVKYLTTDGLVIKQRKSFWGVYTSQNKWVMKLELKEL